MPVNPNPFTFQERDYLRTLFGYPILFSSSNARFENTLNAIDGLYSFDNGATQAAIRTVIASIQALEVTLANLQNLMLSTEVEGKVKVDAIRQDIYQRTVTGPALINQISVRFSMLPATDYFARVKISNAGDTMTTRLNLG
jgi:hypothetical protein